MKHLVGKTVTKKIPFMGDEVEVKKLTVGEVFDLQDVINKSQNKKEKDPKAEIKLLRDILRIAVIGANEISDEDFDGFPISELNALSEEILAVSGLASGKSEGNSL